MVVGGPGEALGTPRAALAVAPARRPALRTVARPPGALCLGAPRVGYPVLTPLGGLVRCAAQLEAWLTHGVGAVVRLRACLFDGQAGVILEVRQVREALEVPAPPAP